MSEFCAIYGNKYEKNPPGEARCPLPPAGYATEYLMLYGIRIGYSSPVLSVVELVKMSTPVSSRSWVRIPPENACERFHKGLVGSTEHAVLSKKVNTGKRRKFPVDINLPDASSRSSA